MKFIILLFFLFSLGISFAQEKDSLISNDTIPFELVEEMAEFPGGEIAMMKWINQNVHYPVMAIENGIQGKVYIDCIIDAEGNVKNAEVIKGVHELLDNEALRVVKRLPQFEPAKQKGKAVPIRYRIPIDFRLM